MYMGDPTHVNIQPVGYWSTRFRRHGFDFDVEGYDGFVRSRRGPDEGDPKPFFDVYPSWSVWTLIRL